jgi:hypothetical protein
MGVPTSEIGYTSATAGRGDHEVHKGHVVALGKKKFIYEYVRITVVEGRRKVFWLRDVASHRLLCSPAYLPVKERFDKQSDMEFWQQASVYLTFPFG